MWDCICSFLVNTKGANLLDTEKKWFSLWYYLEAKIIWLSRNYKKDFEVTPSHDKYSEVNSAATDEVTSGTGSAEGRFTVQIIQFRHHQNGTIKTSRRKHLAVPQTHMIIVFLRTDSVFNFAPSPWNWPSGERRLTHGLIAKVGFRHLKLWCPISRQPRKAPLIEPFQLEDRHLFFPIFGFQIFTLMSLWDGRNKKKGDIKWEVEEMHKASNQKDRHTRLSESSDTSQ